MSDYVYYVNIALVYLYTALPIIIPVLTLFVLICIYSAQKWAHKCYKELQRTNDLLYKIRLDLRPGFVDILNKQKDK